MVRCNNARIAELNQTHLDKPVPGDVWYDGFKPICVVLESNDDQVVICSKLHVPEFGSQESAYWMLRHIEILSHRDFKYKLCSKADNTLWATVAPKQGLHTVTQYKDIKRVLEKKLD